MAANRVRGVDELGGFSEWWSSIPPVTRFFGTIWFAAAAGASSGMFPFRSFALNLWDVITKLQIWRLVTNVTFLAPFSFRFLTGMLWWFVYAPPLERTMSEYDPGDFAYCMIISLLSLDLIGMLNPLIPIYFTAENLVFSILYLWSREHAEQDVSIYGLIKIKGFYLPWAMMGVGMVIGGGMNSAMQDFVGIAVGHLYYFLKTIYPAQTGTYVLKCPIWLSRFMARHYKTSQPADQGTRQTAGFQAFRGRGHRLQD